MNITEKAMNKEIIKNGEISDDELNAVAGGSETYFGYTVVDIDSKCCNGKYQEGDPKTCLMSIVLAAQFGKRSMIPTVGAEGISPDSLPKGCCGSCKYLANNASKLVCRVSQQV